MGAVHEFRLRHNEFVKNLPAYIEGAIDDNEALIDLNRKQLLEGRKASGKYLPAYSDRSVEEFGKPTGPIMLYDTGDFHGSFTIAATKDKNYYVKGYDIYGLAERFGEDIYGIAKWNQPTAKKITTAEIAASYRSAVYTK